MGREAGRLTSARGVELFWQRWLPAGEVQGVLLFVHGLGEHSDRYTHVAERLGASGWATFAFDLRGHGRSAGRRGHIAAFEDYLADVEAVRREAAARFPELPLYLLGHSLGGLITLRYLVERGEGVAGAVISSPYLGDRPELAPPRALDLAARGLSRLCPILPFKTGIRPKYVSRDPEVVRAYREDPRIFDRVTPRFYTETRRAMARVHAAAANWEVPLLLMQSGEDRLVSPAATREWAEEAPAEFVEFVEWEGFYHEMLNELPEARERVFQRIEAWLGCARLAP